MRLIELEPKWLIGVAGERIGFIFRCPTRRQCWQSCFFIASPPRRQQWALFAATLKSDDPDDATMGRHDVQGAREGTVWAAASGAEAADFATLSVTPSIDGSPGGNWHGYITNGEIVGGL